MVKYLATIVVATLSVTFSVLLINLAVWSSYFLFPILVAIWALSFCN